MIEGIRKLEAERTEYKKKLDAAKALTLQWSKEMEEYPDTTAGHSAKVAVGLCIIELEQVLEAEG